MFFDRHINSVIDNVHAIEIGCKEKFRKQVTQNAPNRLTEIKMANQQVHIYDSYKARVESGNVPPAVSPKNTWPADLDGEVWSESRTMSPRWGDAIYGRVFVYTSNLGRVRELQSLDRGMSFQIAVHRTAEDYWSYNRAMGMFHYLNT
jgi:hypothetical protein